jgi:hypothetical protein
VSFKFDYSIFGTSTGCKHFSETSLRAGQEVAEGQYRYSFTLALTSAQLNNKTLKKC